jgi:ribosomal protein L29
MKNKDLKKIKKEDINKKLAELKTELMILQGQSKTGTPPKNPGQINAIKKTMAKLYTMTNKNKEDN